MRPTQLAVLPTVLLICAAALGLAFFLPPAASATASPPPAPQEAETLASTLEARPAGCPLSREFPPGILQWCELIAGSAQAASLEPDLVAALMLLESSGDADAYSANGAVGLLQVMPRDGLAAEFQCPNGPCFASRPTAAELADPSFNVAYGTQMLAGLVQKTGSVREALLHYGPVGVGYAYADTVLQLRDRYRQPGRVME